MSFSSEVKKELSYQIPSARHCRLAELSAITAHSGHACEYVDGSGGTVFRTENPAAARKYFTLLRKTFNITPNVSARQNRNPSGSRVFSVGSCADMTAVKTALVQNRCCKRAYIRGAFLASGSISDPGKGYHLEFVCGSSGKAESLKAMLESFGVESRITIRKKNHVLYIKEGSAIADTLNIMEAHVSLMEFENIRVLKEMRNSVNRQVNCETANLNKTVSAAVKQIEDIRLIRDCVGLGSLPSNLAEIAVLRLEQPGASLKELGEMLDPPVGKSGVNHRLRKLSAIAEDLRDHKEEEHYD